MVAVILIVEDDPFIREMAELMIRDWGHEILSASDVPEALVHLQSPQRIDALFTDIYLKAKVHGGCDIAHKAILLRPFLRVLYTTANCVTDKLQARFGKGSYFLRKPYTEDQLQGSIETLLAA